MDDASSAAATPCGVAVVGGPQAQGKAQSTSDIWKGHPPHECANRGARCWRPGDARLTMRELGLLCLCLCLPQALTFGSGGSRTVSLVRRAGPFACEDPSVESRPAVSTSTAADKLAAELAERSASRPARPMSTGLPPPPGTDGLPVAIQAAIPILLCCIVTFGFDGGGWLYQ